jgi:hypothetical protein
MILDWVSFLTYPYLLGLKALLLLIIFLYTESMIKPNAVDLNFICFLKSIFYGILTDVLAG